MRVQVLADGQWRDVECFRTGAGATAFLSRMAGSAPGTYRTRYGEVTLLVRHQDGAWYVRCEGSGLPPLVPEFDTSPRCPVCCSEVEGQEGIPSDNHLRQPRSLFL